MEADPPATPSASWRAASSIVVGGVGILSRAFLFAASTVEVNGLDGFLSLLNRREDIGARERGLITVSNHVSVLDDPLMWGVLPFSLLRSPDNMRWGLGSHDLMFQNRSLPSPQPQHGSRDNTATDLPSRFTSRFFALGQVLPAHRKAHSAHGGLFQPTIAETIKLLSSQPFPSSKETGRVSSTQRIGDPFSDNHLTYTTDGLDSVPSPSAYPTRRHAWLHVFPEGKIHQKADRTMRYFKWGISRLILESEPCPDLVAVWIEGFDQVMHESRQFPRFIPRIGKAVSVTFGREVDVEAVFGDLRRRWKGLVQRDRMGRPGSERDEMRHLSEELKHGQEAVDLRKECTLRVREEVLKLRRQRGWPDEDPKAGLVDTSRAEGSHVGKREGRMEDGSWVRDT